MKEINRLSGSQVRSVPIKNFSRHQQSVFQSFRTEVNMTPIATLSCKETFTISHYLNRLVRCTQTINWVKHFIQTVFFPSFVARTWAILPIRESMENVIIQMYIHINIQLKWSPVEQSRKALARLWVYHTWNLFSNQPLPINCTEKISTMKSTFLEQ